MGAPARFAYLIYYTLPAGKRKPLFAGARQICRAKNRSRASARLRPRAGYFWKVTPLTVTLTAVTVRPLVLSTALDTLSCTALATSVTP